MMRTLLARLAGMFTGRRAQVRLDEEIETHVALQAAEYEREGMPPEEARATASRAFGHATQMREQHREQRRLPFIDSLWQDLRYTLRQWRKNRGFAATAIVTLALGIGANTAIFQLLDVIVLRSLPVRDPQQLVILHGRVGEAGGFSYPQLVEMSARQNVVEGVFASSSARGAAFRMEGYVSAEPPASWFATGNYFRLIGTTPQAGRFFSEADDNVSAAPVAVISDAFWRARMGAEPSAIGATFSLNRMVFTIVGIARPEFQGERVSVPSDIWVPMGKMPQVIPGSDTRFSNAVEPMARLRTGVPREQAQAALSTLYSQLREFGISFRPDLVSRLEFEPGGQGLDVLQTQYERPLWLLMGIVGLVALIACSNLANLLLARATARTHEMGVRLAIGAARGRLIRQLLTESLALAVAGGSLGLAMASFASRTLVTLAAAGDRWYLPTGFDWRVAGFTVLISLVATILFGLAPALAATHIGLNSALKSARHTHSGGRTRQIASRSFVIAQIALSLILVAGAALLVRSFRNVAYQDFGYQPDGVLMGMLGVEEEDGDELWKPEAHLKIALRAGAIPGIQAAGVSSGGLLASGMFIGGNSFATEDRTLSDSARVRMTPVTPHYIEAMSIPILRGRSITDQDTRDAPRVAVVSETAARLLFGAADPIGRTFSEGKEYRPGRAVRVVGLMPDVRYANPREALSGLVYAPMAQRRPQASPDVVIRTLGDPAPYAEALRQAVSEAAPGFKIIKVETMRSKISRFARRERLLAWLSGGFGALALVLAAVGLYGVVAYAAEQRTAEMGIRLALGPTPGHVRGLLLREVLLLLVAGVAIGGAATFALASSLESLLFEVTPHDPSTMALAAAVLGAVAVAAGFFPARRAARLDPMTALRQE